MIIGCSVISDVLLLLKQKSQEPIIIPTVHNAPDLTELLQKSAVEHLTTFRQLEARYFGSVASIVTTDFEALYAYTNVVTISSVYSCLYKTFWIIIAVDRRPLSIFKLTIAIITNHTFLLRLLSVNRSNVFMCGTCTVIPFHLLTDY